MKNIKRILVPVDFSEASLRAFDRAASLAGALGAEVVVLAVSEADGRGAPADDSIAADRPRVEEEIARFFEERLGGLAASSRDPLKSPPRILVRQGAPVEEILTAAEDEEADLIVMGTHGRRGLERALMGSVAEGVLRRAECPVLVQRAGRGGDVS